MPRLKRWESPRRQGRNDKGKGGSARRKQLKKRQQMLRNKLKRNEEEKKDSSFFYGKVISLKILSQRQLISVSINQLIGMTEFEPVNPSTKLNKQDKFFIKGSIAVLNHLW